MTSAKSIILTTASVAATALLFRSVIGAQLQKFMTSNLRTLIHGFSSTFIIEDVPKQNHLYRAVEIYLEPKIPKGARKNEEIFDHFNGITLKWRSLSESRPQDPTDGKFFELSFNKKHHEIIIGAYMHHILRVSHELKEEKKTLKIFTLKNNRIPPSQLDSPWHCVNLQYPPTLTRESTATKAKIMSELEWFVQHEKFLKTCKGYLLYGPPGGGKSSLIAAMANYLNFDIYEIKLTKLRSNSQLGSLLISTPKNSLLVLKDFDCSHSKNKEAGATTLPGYNPNQVTLLELMDLLDIIRESGCLDDKFIVFTTHHIEELDPPDKFLRRGLLNKHIYVPYSSSSLSKMLAPQSSPIFRRLEQIEDQIKTLEVNLAEACEHLMEKNEMPDLVRGLIEFLEEKKLEESEHMTIISSYGDGNRDYLGKTFQPMHESFLQFLLHDFFSHFLLRVLPLKDRRDLCPFC